MKAKQHEEESKITQKRNFSNAKRKVEQYQKESLVV